jgi:hypothetical protein
MGKKIRTKQPRRGILRLEGPYAAEHLATVVSSHPDRSDIAGLLVNVEIRGMVNAHASVGEIYRALRVMRKPRQELLANMYHLVGLPAGARYLPRDEDVLAVTKHSPEGIAREGFRGCLVPSHDHSSIQATRERHPDAFMPVEISRQHPGEELSEL